MSYILTLSLKKKKKNLGTSLEIQRLRCRASTVGGACSIPGQGTRSHMPPGAAQKKKNNYKLSKLFSTKSTISFKNST